MGQVAVSTPRNNGRNRKVIHLDMTPMVDLAFLLLTFFVLTVTLNKTHVMPIATPEKNNDQQTPVHISRVLNVVLGEHNKLYVYHGENPEVKLTEFSTTGIRNVLIKEKLQMEKMVLLIKPSKLSRYKNLVDILDEITITGVQHYYIVEETVEDQALIASSGL